MRKRRGRRAGVLLEDIHEDIIRRVCQLEPEQWRVLWILVGLDLNVDKTAQALDVSRHFVYNTVESFKAAIKNDPGAISDKHIVDAILDWGAKIRSYKRAVTRNKASVANEELHEDAARSEAARRSIGVPRAKRSRRLKNAKKLFLGEPEDRQVKRRIGKLLKSKNPALKAAAEKFADQSR